MPDGALARISESMLPAASQFERTLIVADDDAYVSYLEGCTAPMRDENQLHAAIVEIICEERSEVKYSTVQNWYAQAIRMARVASTTL